MGTRIVERLDVFGTDLSTINVSTDAAGGTAIFESLGIKLESLKLTDLGRAKKVIVDKDNTTVIEGAGKSADIKADSFNMKNFSL